MAIAIGLLVTSLVATKEARGDGVDACRDYAQYGRHPGTTVRIMSGIRDVEAASFKRSFFAFKKCTGIDIVWDGRAGFEQALNKSIAAHSMPELAILDQPGQIRALARARLLKPASAELTTRAIRDYPVTWLTYGTLRSEFYAPPLGVTVKSWVWYSPTVFRRRDWKVPTTWPELLDLTERIAADGRMKPWCDGTQEGAATGRTLTDWVEDVVLRLYGTDTYRQWAQHQVGFSDDQIVKSFDEVGKLLRDPRYSNGGNGDPASIASTPAQEAGLPVLDGQCAMFRQSSSWVNQWPGGTEIARDGDVWAFPLPGLPKKPNPLLVGGEFLARFGGDEATEMVQRFMISPEFANLRASEGGWISPHRGLRLTSVPGKLDGESLRMLRVPSVVVAFDASDAMPDAVGSRAFWIQATRWIQGQSTKETTELIDAAWPR